MVVERIGTHRGAGCIWNQVHETVRMKDAMVCSHVCSNELVLGWILRLINAEMRDILRWEEECDNLKEFTARRSWKCLLWYQHHLRYAYCNRYGEQLNLPWILLVNSQASNICTVTSRNYHDVTADAKLRRNVRNWSMRDLNIHKM